MKKWILCLVGSSFFFICFAQENPGSLSVENQITEHNEILKKLQKLKISGYIQTQYQWGQEDASLKVGTKNENPDQSFNRIGIRRGRIKFVYEDKIASGTFQLDMTDKGIKLKDAFLQVTDPWFGTNALRAGIFDRPFGFEIGHSSSRRESPERSTIFQTLFPDERDMGAMIRLQPDKNATIHFLKLEAGLFAGNGINEETDNRKDFIGHFSAHKEICHSITLGGSFSYYHGGVYQGTENVYRMDGKSFVPDNDPDNKGKFAKRQYYGLDAQFYMNTSIGMTQLRLEYLFGQQPGNESGSKSPNSSALPVTDTYIRKFNGGYIIFIQDLGITPLSAVLKYDWYDPNTKVKKDEIGLGHTGQADVLTWTYGIGILWKINSALRVQAYYDFNHNEKTVNLATYSDNRKDNVFTLRMQYKF